MFHLGEPSPYSQFTSHYGADFTSYRVRQLERSTPWAQVQGWTKEPDWLTYSQSWAFGHSNWETEDVFLPGLLSW